MKYNLSTSAQNIDLMTECEKSDKTSYQVFIITTVNDCGDSLSL